MSDNKGRIIFLAHYLADHADENNPITTEALITALSEKGYSANRNTIRSDIEALKAKRDKQLFEVFRLEKKFLNDPV